MAIPGALRSPLLLVAVLTALLLLPGAAVGQERERPVIYKWVDENGIAHYTTDPDRVPDELRGLARELHRERRASAPELPEPTEEDPWAAVSPTVEEDPWAVAAEEPSSLWAVTDSAGEIPPAGSAKDDDAFAATDTSRKEALRNLDARIAALEAEITRDEDRLKDWLTDPSIAADEAADDAEFQAIARRLPDLHAQMRELLEEKASVEGRAP